MKCAVHADVDATAFCRNCGKALCPACTHEVRGALYCETCIAGLVSAPPTEPRGARADVHPGAALALGFIPGLGAVYNGEYIKALIHVFVFAGLIAAQSGNVSAGYHAFLGIALGCFYLYMPIEAYRTAKAREAGEAAPAPLGEGEMRRPVGAIILVALGVLLLLGNFGMLEWGWLAKGWPLALIVLGVWMLVGRLRGKS
jgi:hypothetical protein